MSEPKIGLVTLMRLTEADARALMESMRWPDGPVCPHCGVVNEATRVEKHKKTSKAREGLWNCKACREQFSVTVGTVMEGSHIPLAKWIAAVHILCSSKKSVSALQLQRQLELGSYRTAWHLCHRVRHMLANGGPMPPLSGIVEADEMYVGGKPRRHARSPKTNGKRERGRGTTKTPVAVLVSRDGGARARALTWVGSGALKGFIREHVARSTRIMTDEFTSYQGLRREFASHETTHHASGEYARGDVHSNTAESFNGLFKRSVLGAWHHVSREHIGRYLDEACFRWSNRDVSDWERTQLALLQADGVRLYYKKPRRQGEQDGARLVADG